MVYTQHCRFPEETRNGFGCPGFSIGGKEAVGMRGRFGRLSLVSLRLVLISAPVTEYRAGKQRYTPDCLTSFSKLVVDEHLSSVSSLSPLFFSACAAENPTILHSGFGK